MIKKILTIVIVAIVLLVAWFLVSPLFRNSVVSESLPGSTREQVVIGNMAIEEVIPESEQLENMSPVALEAIRDDVMERSAALPDINMDEPMPGQVAGFAPTEGPQPFAEGQFRGADAFHQASGSATLYRQDDDTVFLRLEDFMVTNGPDLRVLLVSEAVLSSGIPVSDTEYVELEKLKGNVGNQNYEIPDSVAIGDYGAVVIYCKPFHVIFGEAILNPLDV
ncbi:MAG: hypothetical protein ACI83D_000301 [Planctomycetota bacterium]|jgi:hypothetical protein